MSGRARVATVMAVGALGLAWAGAGVAAAHVGVTSTTDEAGAYAVLSFSVPHGCEGSPTTEIAVQVPAGINSVTPTRNALYTLETVTETLDEPVADSHGNEVTERVAEVVWTATTPLPDGQRDVLELSLQLPAEAAGTTLHFPVVQTCEEGESAWVEVPAAGQDPHDLAFPAPSLDVVAGSGGHGHSDDESGGADDAGSGEGDDPGSAEAGWAAGPDAWSLAGLGAGALGVVLGAAALVRSRKGS
ncbi:YcnI family copper-binding membrane protein [Tessaracoccus terricola]